MSPIKNIPTYCDKCGKRITDDTFAGGFKRGFKNMMFHIKCLDQVSRNKMILRLSRHKEKE